MLHDRMWTLRATAVGPCVALAMAATAIAAPYFVRRQHLRRCGHARALVL
jgi:hypothetical protein